MEETLVAEPSVDSARRRAAAERAVREFRRQRTAVAMAVAAVVTALCLAGSGEIVARHRGRHLMPGSWTDGLDAELHRLPWRAEAVGLAGYCLELAGFALLVLAVTPGRTGLEPMCWADPLVSAALTRAGLARAVLDAAWGVGGVEEVRVRIGWRIVVTAWSGHGDPGALCEPMRRAVAGRLEEIAPLRRRRVVVRLKRWR